MPTADEIQALKGEWQRDTSWNIEDTEGFEEHRDELRAWRFVFEAEYEEFELQQLRKRALDNGRTVDRQQAIERAALA